jgi:hypothetical protein
MATDRNLYAVARTVRPREVEAAAPHLAKLATPLVLLNGRELRQDVERSINRSLLWEEWLDIRRDWCNANLAYLCDAVLGDPDAIARCSEIARLQGHEYLLLEVI